MSAPAVSQNPFVEFLERYEHDWVAMSREVFGIAPDADQASVLRAACNDERRISWRSGHGVGKSTTLSLVVGCQLLTRFPQRTACTAPTEKQMFGVLAADVKKHLKRLPQALFDLLEIKAESIHLRARPEESFVTFATSRPETPEALAGVHSEGKTLLIADEASGVHDAVFESASGSMSGHLATTILAGNPVRTSGLFFDTHHKLRDSWLTLKTSCVGHPRIAPDYVEDMRRRYGEESNAFRVRVLGEFPKADDDTIIPFELVEAALRRDITVHADTPIIWGVDCARFGSDKSALCKRQGTVLLEPVEAWGGLDTMALAGKVKAAYDESIVKRQKPAEINIDVIGIGAGVMDRLRELGLPVRGINVGEQASANEVYRGLRSELWFRGKEWFERRDCSIAGDEGLLGELVPQKYRYLSSGKLEALSKDEMKRFGQASPNKADAFLLTLASDPITLAHGGGRRTWTTAIKRTIKGIV